MSYCLNPNCSKPQNPKTNQFCQSCGSKLLLRERYCALKRIGKGAFGKTYLAVDEDKPSKPPCVIKQFAPEDKNVLEKATQLFNREAEWLEKLGKHTQIPELLGHFSQDNHLYLVQEYIDGQNLAEELKAKGVFNETQIRELLKSLLPVLQFVHENNVIHRDIKLENIIRRRDGQYVLVDFGAVRMMTGTALLQTQSIIYTPGYAAPEQLDGRATFASDLYSLGVTCLVLMTQINLPWDLRDGDGNWVWRDYLVNNRVSDSLGQILDRMVQKEPRHRYQSAAEVLQALNPSVVGIKERFQKAYRIIAAEALQALKSSKVSSTPSSSPVQPPASPVTPKPKASQPAFVNNLIPFNTSGKWGYKEETGHSDYPASF